MENSKKLVVQQQESIESLRLEKYQLNDELACRQLLIQQLEIGNGRLVQRGNDLDKFSADALVDKILYEEMYSRTAELLQGAKKEKYER